MATGRAKHRAYYAAGLFNEGERQFNLKVKRMLDELGFETWFPQEDAGFIEDYLAHGGYQALRHVLRQVLPHQDQRL